MGELRKARVSLSDVVGMQSTARKALGPLSGPDLDLLHLCPLDLQGGFLSVSPPNHWEKNRNSGVTRLEACTCTQDQNTPICTNLDVFSEQIMCSKVLRKQSRVNTVPEICCTHQ